MRTFFCKLVPPRPSFGTDMSAEEAHLMHRHAEYWRTPFAGVQVVAFGFVAAPAAGFGVGIVEVEDGTDVRSFTEKDPTIRSERGFRYEVYPMPLGVVRG